MEKQKHQNLIKRYVAFFVFCLALLLLGIVFSLSINLDVRSVGEKPPFLFALLFSVMLLAAAVGSLYLSYLYWFQSVKARKNLTATIEQLTKRSIIYRLPIYNPAFLFWFIRLTVPIMAILVSGLFFLVVFSAF